MKSRSISQSYQILSIYESSVSVPAGKQAAGAPGKQAPAVGKQAAGEAKHAGGAGLKHAGGAGWKHAGAALKHAGVAWKQAGAALKHAGAAWKQAGGAADGKQAPAPVSAKQAPALDATFWYAAISSSVTFTSPNLSSNSETRISRLFVSLFSVIELSKY